MGPSLSSFGFSFGFFGFNVRASDLLLGMIVSAICLGSGLGCQSVKTERIESERAFIDFTGLAPLVTYADLKATGSIPQGWEPLPLTRTALYSHEQWRSPTLTTGVGIADIHLPLPVPASAVLWFAQHEYTAQAADGKALGRWTDEAGRQWFSAENKRFYVRGYVVTRGLDAWIVYCGFRRQDPPNPYEYSLAIRSLETIIPGGSKAMAASRMAVASAAN